jgi:hypothetical protein
MTTEERNPADAFAFSDPLELEGVSLVSSGPPWDSFDSYCEEWLDSEETLEEVRPGPVWCSPDTATVGQGGRHELSSLGSVTSSNTMEQQLPSQDDSYDQINTEDVPLLSEFKTLDKWEPSEFIIFDDEIETKPSTVDESGDIISSQCSRVEVPVSKIMRVDLENIAHHQLWGQKVRKSWRHLILTGATVLPIVRWHVVCTGNYLFHFPGQQVFFRPGI